jgi:hypothetical protein
VVLLGCHCAAGDGGGEGGTSNLGAPLRMSRMMLSRVCPGTPQNKARPSLFQLLGPPTRPAVLYISISYLALKYVAHHSSLSLAAHVGSAHSLAVS